MYVCIHVCIYIYIYIYICIRRRVQGHGNHVLILPLWQGVVETNLVVF